MQRSDGETSGMYPGAQRQLAVPLQQPLPGGHDQRPAGPRKQGAAERALRCKT
jgi:hypothetical protein